MNNDRALKDEYMLNAFCVTHVYKLEFLQQLHASFMILLPSCLILVLKFEKLFQFLSSRTTYPDKCVCI